MFVALTIDLDSKNQNIKNDVENLDFNFKKELLQFLKEIKKPVTFFTREDQQTIESNESLIPFVKSMSENFDIEIGWHPHFFEKNNTIKNLDYLLQCLKDVWQKTEWVRECKIVRIGACQNSNEIMDWLSDKFIIDSSAMPGCVRKDSFRNYDWETTKQSPYFPNREDYRTPGDLKILEIPISTIFVKTNYDTYPKRRIVNLNYKCEIFKESINNNIEELKNTNCIVTCSHADELEFGYENDLYCFGIETYLKNISFLEEKFEIQYTKLEDYANWWKSSYTTNK